MGFYGGDIETYLRFGSLALHDLWAQPVKHFTSTGQNPSKQLVDEYAEVASLITSLARFVLTSSVPSLGHLRGPPPPLEELERWLAFDTQRFAAFKLTETFVSTDYSQWLDLVGKEAAKARDAGLDGVRALVLQCAEGNVAGIDKGFVQQSISVLGEKHLLQRMVAAYFQALLKHQQTLATATG